MKYTFNILILGVVLYSLSKYNENKRIASQQAIDKARYKKDSLMRVEEIRLQDSLKRVHALEIENRKIKYSAFIFPKNKKDSAMGVFKEMFSKEQRYKILAINRLDDKNKWRADTLVIPNKLDLDFIKYSPYPTYVDILRNVEKIAFFSYKIHAYGLYENGNLVKWGPTSMGKKSTPTLTSLHFTNWKKELAISTSNSSWKLRWNFNIHNRLGFGWHQYDLPGFHASHSCMRLLEKDAKWMYEWANQWVLTSDGDSVLAKGTPVMVFGETDFKSRPWIKLAEDYKADHYSTEDMKYLVMPHLDEILEEQEISKQYRVEKER